MYLRGLRGGTAEESIDITRYSQGMVVCSHVYGEVVGFFELTSQYLSFERSMENLRYLMGQGGYRESWVLEITCNFPILGGLKVQCP